MGKRRRVLLVQLPIPPSGLQPVRGNVPLAAGYLKLFARRSGLEERFEIDIFPAALANGLSDRGLVEAILARGADLVGFTCYLWNIERSLWIAARLREANPKIRIVIGGPEVTADNDWVINHAAIDYAVCGEGEQTFAELLRAIETDRFIPGTPGLHLRGRSLTPPPFRTPIPKLDEISSPYTAGILDAGDEKLMLLETIRGCVFKCKFCYYPKSYDGLYFLSEDRIEANLRHAAERGVTEVVLLDPTLNQRKHFNDFVKLLAKLNPNRQWTYFGELRGEGVGAETAKLLREANFTEVEVGLQSVDPKAQELMARKNGKAAFERGATAMIDAGLRVKVDLIVGLPGDTVESVREGLNYLHGTGLYHDVQVFQLSILPGTAFRQEANELGLRFQPRPPYYVLQTPTFDLAAMGDLMAEAQELFGCEFDALPPPKLEFSEPGGSSVALWTVDFDGPRAAAPPSAKRAQAFAVWFRGKNLASHLTEMEAAIRELLEANPHSTLQITVEQAGRPERLSPTLVEGLLAAAHVGQSYLDKFYALQPGRPQGAKRVVVVADGAYREQASPDWEDAIFAIADLVWRMPDGSFMLPDDVEELAPEPA
jgi:radical SAM superfamily enzyme YgiQ (UPF0313 family)